MQQANKRRYIKIANKKANTIQKFCYFIFKNKGVACLLCNKVTRS